MKFKPTMAIIAALMLCLASDQALSGTLQLEYKSFYSHLKKLNDDELALLQFAFGFQHVTKGALCKVESVLIKTDKKDIPVQVNEDNRFVLPSEKALKLANAEVIVELNEMNNQCDLSVKLQVVPEDFVDGVDASKLEAYYQAFVAFFDEMGGFLSFMMPSPEGLIINVTNESAQQASGSLFQKSEKQNQLKMPAQNITKFNDKLIGVTSVTAWMP